MWCTHDDCFNENVTLKYLPRHSKLLIAETLGLSLTFTYVIECVCVQQRFIFEALASNVDVVVFSKIRI